MSVTVVDGGFSTQLSRYVGDIIDGDPLWSARFLHTDPEFVRQVHLDYLNAGAGVIITNSYQASVQGFNEYLGLDAEESVDLIKKSVQLAKQARNEFMENNPTDKRPLIAGSVGPYGASLHDGSEYTGCYIHKVSRDTIKEWHRPRVQALVEAGVDLLAIETIPAQAEAEVLLDLIKEFPQQKAWISFQCKDSKSTAHGEDFNAAVRRCWELSSQQLVAVGCNCLHPNHVTGLLKAVRRGDTDGDQIPLIVYPNSGETYSPDQGWSGQDECVNPITFVEEWLDLGVKYVGGCCRTDARHVERISKIVKQWHLHR